MIKEAVSSSVNAVKVEALVLDLPTAAATRRLGATLGKLAQPGDLIGLCGPLGAGKTCLTGGLAKGLGVRGAVTSPTFTLINEHAGRLRLYHVDLYRLTREEELVELGLAEAAESGGVMAVEWLSRFPKALSQDRLDIELSHTEGGKRRAVVTGGGPQSFERLAALKRCFS